MKKLFTLAITALALCLSQPMLADVDYTPTFTGSRTNTNRGIKNLNLQSASYQGYSANSLTISNSEDGECYVDKSGTVTMKAGAGESVTLSVGIKGEWMNAYVYIDSDRNGFTAGVADDRYSPTGDLLSYSFYNNGSSSDESG